jgi:hypothetical protein
VQSIKRLRPALAIPAFALLMALAVDLTHAVRPSGLAALACTSLLFRQQPDALGIAVSYRDTIAEQAARQNLPAELLAAVIINHQAYITPVRRFTDCFGSALGANLSLGLAQMRLSTAAQIDGALLETMSPSEFRSLRAQLLDAESNIVYAARELRALLEQKNRYPGMSADTLIHDPFVMALLITEYRMGRLQTPSESSHLTASAFGALRWIQNETLELFDRDAADARVVQSQIGEYLHFINCESGIFNATACKKYLSEISQ